MGHITYAGSTEYAMDDQVLAHVDAVVRSKLRRSEGFMLSWDTQPGSGPARVSLWMAPGIPVQVRYSGSRLPQLDPVWLEALDESANHARGMVVMTQQEAHRAALAESRERSR